MNEADDRPARRPRADALRNRERVLAAAKQVFGAGGADASLEAVAREAGVGIGTLYRHFPTREVLFEQVYRHEVEQLVLLADALLEEPPVAALRRWMHANVDFIATKKGMATALAVAVSKSSPLTAYSIDRLPRALDRLVQRAIAAGEIRDDVSADDLVRTLVGICYAQDRPGWQKGVQLLVDVIVDGLRRPGR